MVFSSIPFLFYFLPCVLILYFLAPEKLKNATLLLCSLVFYAWGEPTFALVMMVSITQSYIFGLLTARGNHAKLWLACTVTLSLAMLGYCKYADFFIENFNAVTGLSIPLLNVALPIGISFYTFQIVSYNIDVYRREVPVQKNYVNLAAYVTMFPQLIAGPIVRYSCIAEQLEHRTHTIDKAAQGVRRFILGLSKKVLLANTLGELCDLFRAAELPSVLFFWLYAVAFAMQLYFDFSGYSDMAIGLGKIFGFEFMENFNFPYISKSITEFWRRWHMSLGSWFRDYVYIPLGGNRVKQWRWLLNIFIVWMLTGLWHGASWNFVAWGLFFGLLLMIEKLFLLRGLKKTRVLNHVYVLLAVIISFVIFDATDTGLGGMLARIGALFGAGSYPAVSVESLYYLRSYGVLLLIGVIAATPLPKLAVARLRENKTAAKVLNILEPLVLVALLVAVTAYLVDSSFNPFLYFRF